MTDASPARCFVCGARDLRPTDRTLRYGDGRQRPFRLACASCGVLLDDPGAMADARHHAERALAGDRYASDFEAPYGLDIYTLRTLASAHGRAVRPSGPEQAKALISPHAALAADAALIDPPSSAQAAITLAILCRATDAPAVLARASAYPAWTDDVLVLVDAETAEALPERAGVRVAARPLAGDFSKQRNAAQDLARHAWVFQLDADETVDAALFAALGRLATGAGAEVRSIGLPRRNLVDGVLSDLYPDTQYRLNRRDVRYGGRVHERPALGSWRESFIALPGAIQHHLDRAHVEARSQRYEAMAPGGGRLFESEALLRPFQP